MDEDVFSPLLLTTFFAGLGISFFVMYQTMIVHQNFAVFTDEETVPEATDFIAALMGSSE